MKREPPSASSFMKPLALCVFTLCFAAACASATPKPAPPPRRPLPMAQKEAPKDCMPWSIAALPPAVPHDRRSIEESENLAEAASQLLGASQDRGKPLDVRQRLMTDAVDRLITALLADPYNVEATYVLAATYARIGRAQCAVNLLGRLGALEKLPSLRAAASAKIDLLLGRGEFRGRMDPDFFELRDDPRFREVVAKF